MLKDVEDAVPVITELTHWTGYKQNELGSPTADPFHRWCLPMGTLVHVLTGHAYSFSCEVAVPNFCYFLMYCHFIVGFYEFFCVVNTSPIVSFLCHKYFFQSTTCVFISLVVSFDIFFFTCFSLRPFVCSSSLFFGEFSQEYSHTSSAALHCYFVMPLYIIFLLVAKYVILACLTYLFPKWFYYFTIYVL